MHVNVDGHGHPYAYDLLWDVFILVMCAMLMATDLGIKVDKCGRDVHMYTTDICSS